MENNLITKDHEMVKSFFLLLYYSLLLTAKFRVPDLDFICC